MRHNETKQREINGKMVEATPWPPRHGIRMQAKLAKILAPITKLAGGGSNLKGLMDQDISDILPDMLAGLDDEKADELITKLLYCVRVDNRDVGNESNFNELFAANYLFMYKVIAFALEVNFGDFFELASATGDNQSQSQRSTPKPAK